MNKAIIRSPGKQLKSTFLQLALDVFPQIASCLAFVGSHNFIHRLLGGLWLTPEDSNHEVEQWPDLNLSMVPEIWVLSIMWTSLLISLNLLDDIMFST